MKQVKIDYSSSREAPRAWPRQAANLGFVAFCLCIFVSFVGVLLLMTPTGVRTLIIVYPLDVLLAVCGTGSALASLLSRTPRNWRGVTSLFLNLMLLCVLVTLLAAAYLEASKPARMGGGP